MDREKIRNPYTGRWIDANGTTAKRLGLVKQSTNKRLTLEEEYETRVKLTPGMEINLRREIRNKTKGQGSRTRGAREAAPKHGRERHALTSVCGSKCFLLPEQEKFPICSGTVFAGKPRCDADCRLLEAAFIRARQYRAKYPGLAEKAEAMLIQHGCPRGQTRRR